jgi:hypothetical protein
MASPVRRSNLVWILLGLFISRLQNAMNYNFVTKLDTKSGVLLLWEARFCAASQFVLASKARINPRTKGKRVVSLLRGSDSR